jgi:hypothetical protein
MAWRRGRPLARPEGCEWNTKKPLTWTREVRYAARSGAEVTKLGMGGNQARMNKQYSGHSWRPPWPGLADASERLGMQSIGFLYLWVFLESGDNTQFAFKLF